jgi:hypothetical protein
MNTGYVMKLFAAFFAVAFLCAPAAHADTPYYEIAHNSDRSVNILVKPPIETQYLNKRPNTVTVWVLYTYSPYTKPNMRYSFVYRRFNCKDRYSTDLSRRDFKVLNDRETSVWSGNYGPAIAEPETLEYAALNFICSGTALSTKASYKTLEEAVNSVRSDPLDDFFAGSEATEQKGKSATDDFLKEIGYGPDGKPLKKNTSVGAKPKK